MISSAMRAPAMVKVRRVWYRSPSLFVAIMIGSLTLVALVHVWVHLQVLSLGYDISHETQARHDLSEMNQRLSLELRTRMDLTVVERAARENLHMVPPDPQKVRVLKLASSGVEQ